VSDQLTMMSQTIQCFS